MTNYLWVCEIFKNREWVPYIARKRKGDADLVKSNAERTTNSKYRVEKYERKRK